MSTLSVEEKLPFTPTRIDVSETSELRCAVWCITYLACLLVVPFVVIWLCADINMGLQALFTLMLAFGRPVRRGGGLPEISTLQYELWYDGRRMDSCYDGFSAIGVVRHTLEKALIALLLGYVITALTSEQMGNSSLIAVLTHAFPVAFIIAATYFATCVLYRYIHARYHRQ